jgi:hypothetical protein
MPLVAAAAITAGGALLANRSNNSAQRSAANASQQATDTATAEQRRQYDLSRGDNAPWLQAGGSALAQLSRLYGLGGAQTDQQRPNGPTGSGLLGTGGTSSGGYQMPYTIGGSGSGNVSGLEVQAVPAFGDGREVLPGESGGPQTLPFAPGAAPTGAAGMPGQYDTFWQSPDYNFRQQEQARALTARNAALGIQDSGAAQRSAMQYSGNLASSEYNNYANRLAALAGVGQTAAAQNQQLGQNYAGAVGGLAMNNADNLASSYRAGGQNNANLWGSLAGIGSGYIGQRWPVGA